MKSLFEQLNNIPREGCKDMWNAFMVKTAVFSEASDMPTFESTDIIPQALIGYDDAKHIHKQMVKDNPEYTVKAFVHFYIDDDKFDGKRSSIWLYPSEAYEVLCHFTGIVTPDFSTNQDFPEPWKVFNTYRMRCFGYWIHSLGIPVIHNVRWGTEESWHYCFDGIPQGSSVFIGTSASGLNLLVNRPVFEHGLIEMVKRIQPNVIMVYGSSNYSFFDSLRENGINIITFPSKTSCAYKKEVPL